MDNRYMKIALNEAEKSYNENEVPVGCVIVKDGSVLAKAHNKKEKQKSCLKHAEIIAIEKAIKKIGNWRLDNCIIYVTMEPCPMCASLIQQSRMKKVYIGVENLDKNNKTIINMIFSSSNINKAVITEYGLCAEESKILLEKFFQNRRN